MPSRDGQHDKFKPMVPDSAVDQAEILASTVKSRPECHEGDSMADFKSGCLEKLQDCQNLTFSSSIIRGRAEYP